MTRSPLILLAALLPLFALAGCSREAALEGDGLAADIAINQQRPVAMKFALTGLKDGRVALTSRCNGYTSSRYLYVR